MSEPELVVSLGLSMGGVLKTGPCDIRLEVA